MTAKRALLAGSTTVGCLELFSERPLVPSLMAGVIFWYSEVDYGCSGAYGAVSKVGTSPDAKPRRQKIVFRRADKRIMFAFNCLYCRIKKRGVPVPYVP
jgi:hypothetical protein